MAALLLLITAVLIAIGGTLAILDGWASERRARRRTPVPDVASSADERLLVAEIEQWMKQQLR